MKLKSFWLGMAAAVLTASSASAQLADHLQCFKIKDAAAKASYTADITPSDAAFAAAIGCTVTVPAKLLCVDSQKTNVNPSPPGSGPGLQAQQYLCYKTKCPKNQPTKTVADQFGSHSITVKKAGYVCAPVEAGCTDGQLNGDETDTDCGGSCGDCPLGDSCVIDSDCASGSCVGGVCVTATPSCSDAQTNGNETGVDCGGGTCPDCPNGQGCSVGNDCISGVCMAGICQAPSCSDGVNNGTESGIDCGSSCPDCPNGQGCFVGNDCISGVCMAGVCQAPSCSDGVKNGTETGVDCGGGSCPSCPNGQMCTLDGDCTSGICSGGVCVAPAANGAPCSFAQQCASASCVDGVCCDGACTGTCSACTAAKKGAGADGACGVINSGGDPDAECADLPQTTCGTTGVCDGNGACELHPGGAECIPQSCSGITQTNASQCDGVGGCTVGGANVDCTPYFCSGTACDTDCATNADCVPPNSCAGSVCQ